MKRRNLLIAVAAILVMFAFVACSESVAPEDRLGTITFGENSSRAVGTVVTYSNEVENMVWLYKATKLDDGYTTGQTSDFVAVAEPTSTTADSKTTYTAVKGLSGKTLNNFSYGLWKIELRGYKEENVTASSTGVAINDGKSDKYEYSATIDNFLVDSGANYAKAEIQLGENPETTIVFDTVNGISFKSDNIKVNSDFTLTVSDNKGTVTVGTATNDVVKADGSVTFKNLTYKLNDNAVIMGEHEMTFVLTQTLSGTGNTSITAARYTLKFTVQPGTKNTISGDLVKTDETGTIEITSVQDVEPLTLSKVMEVTVNTENNTATVSKAATINYGDLEVVYPVGTVISTEAGSVEGSLSDAKIGFKYKTTSEQTGITIDATEAKMTFDLSLSASTSTDTATKNSTLITVKKFIGKGLTISTIYHGGTQIDKLTSASATVPADKESYYYDSDGYLTLHVFHASEFNIITKGAVAAVGDKKYYSLKDAITNVSDGGTVTLLSNVTVDSKIEIKENITLDLKNKVVSFKEGVSIALSEGKVVTIENSTASQTSLISEVEVKSFSGTERSYYTSLDSALAAVKEGGTVTLLKDNVPLSNDVVVSVTFTLDLNSKTVTANEKYVIVEDGALIVKDKAPNQSDFICGISGANGTYTVGAVRIGGTAYATLDDAVKSLKDASNKTATINVIAEEVTLGNLIDLLGDGAYATKENLDTLKNYSITFEGKGTDKTRVRTRTEYEEDGTNRSYNDARGASLTFKNMTVWIGYEKEGDVSSKYSPQGFMYAGSLSFDSCKIEGYGQHWGKTTTFTNCTFSTEKDWCIDIISFASRIPSATEHNITVTFKECMFSSGTGEFIDIYPASATSKYTVTVEDCTFKNTWTEGSGYENSGRAAVFIKTKISSKSNASVLNCDVTFKGTNTYTGTLGDNSFTMAEGSTYKTTYDTTWKNLFAVVDKADGSYKWSSLGTVSVKNGETTLYQNTASAQ